MAKDILSSKQDTVGPGRAVDFPAALGAPPPSCMSPVSPISCLLLFLFPPPPVRSQSRIPPVSDVSVLSVFGFCVFLCLPVPSPSPLPTHRHTDTHTLLLLLGKPALPPDAPFREAKVRTTVSHSEGQSLGNCLTPLTQELLLRCPPWPQKHPSGDK